MASIPKGTCNICRTIKEGVSVVNENLKKNIKLYVFLSIILIEFLSIRLQNFTTQTNYAFEIYPMFTSLELFLIMLAVYYHSPRLRFCIRQKLIILFLMLYFLFNFIVVVYPICWSSYFEYVNYSILSVLIILLLATWRNL